MRFVLFFACEIFSYKKYKKVWNGPNDLIYFATALKALFVTLKNLPAILLTLNSQKLPLEETPWLTGHHATPEFTLFFIITMLLAGHHAMPVVI